MTPFGGRMSMLNDDGAADFVELLRHTLTGGTDAD